MSTWNRFSETARKELPWKLQRYGLNFYLNCRELYYILVLIHCCLIPATPVEGRTWRQTCLSGWALCPPTPGPQSSGGSSTECSPHPPRATSDTFLPLSSCLNTGSTLIGGPWRSLRNSSLYMWEFICHWVSFSVSFKVLQQDEGVKEKGQGPWGRRMHTFSLWLKSSVKSIIL